MSLVFKQIKVYTKLSLIVALVAVILLIVRKNAPHNVDVWFFRSYKQINVLWLILFTSVGSIVSWWVLSTTWSLWKDMRDLKHAADAKGAEEEQKRLAEKLADTEKRIDDKLADAIRKQP